MEQPSYEVRIVGARDSVMGDLYHAALRLSWARTIAAIVTAFMVINAIFALGFLAVGGIANARPGNFADAFFFSVQTMGTIGYGAMSPKASPPTCWWWPRLRPRWCSPAWPPD
jgi:inward rectifier potassium channel